MEGDFRRVSLSGRRRDFNPLPPYGGRLDTTRAGDLVDVISIHSLRMEGDKHCAVLDCRFVVFQSTPSVWRETQRPEQSGAVRSISIHSLRMEGDGSGN